MALRTPEQYVESLRDGRTVYYRGERVADVTEHPELGSAVRHAALEYASAQDPAHADLTTYPDAAGTRQSRYWKLPEGPDDLLRRHALIDHGTRVGHGVFLIIKEIGSDFLFAHTIVSHQMQEALKAPYFERLRAYHRHVEQHDGRRQAHPAAPARTLLAACPGRALLASVVVSAFSRAVFSPEPENVNQE